MAPKLLDNSQSAIRSAADDATAPSDKTKTTTPSPNPKAAMMFFFLVTSGYCLINIFLGSDTTQKVVIKICYFLFVVLGQYFINLNLSEAMCGVRQWKSVIYITIIPWITIFGVLHLFLTMFNGWLSPFANTFGYFVAKLMGLPDLMKQILESVGEGEASQALISVSSDSSLLINQFSPEASITERYADGRPTGRNLRPKFDSAWDKLKQGKILKSTADDIQKAKLYNFVEMKYNVAEYVWNILTGFLVTSISYNFILNSACSKSPKEMKELYDKYEAEEKARLEKKKKDDLINPTYVQSR